MSLVANSNSCQGPWDTGWLGKSARSYPAWQQEVLSPLPSALCGVGPVVPAPDCLPSHHHPVAGGLTHAASSSIGSGHLEKKGVIDMEKSHSFCFGISHQQQLPALSRNVSMTLPSLCLCVPMPCLTTTQTKWAPLWQEKTCTSWPGLTLSGMKWNLMEMLIPFHH